MLPVLSGAEARVLGSLIEKEATTPEYYPLSVNALMNACNQKSNRDPMMCLTENDVRATLRSLTDQYLVRPARNSTRRSSKSFSRFLKIIGSNCAKILALPSASRT